MREPPKLAEASVVEALEANYGLSIRALAFLPLGADSGSAAYRVEAADRTVLFLKARKGQGFSARSLVVPRYLTEQGVPHILAPLETTAQALWVLADGFALSLFPFLEGRMAADVGLSGQEWRDFGATVKEIHASRLPPALTEILPREEFVPTRRDVLAKLEAAITRGGFTDPLQERLAVFWKSRQREIGALVDRCDALALTLRRASAPLVLCHADLHTWNVLVDARREFWLVDWDETILAPKERDLMFVVGGIGRDLVRPRETARFLEGYGDSAIDPLALAYYRYAWALQDMAAYAEQVFYLPDLGEENRRDAFDGFVDVFAPGSIVTIARASDAAGCDAA